jgi:hypothetical protein
LETICEQFKVKTCLVATFLQFVQIICPKLHHLPTLGKLSRPVVGSSIWVFDGMGKPVLDKEIAEGSCLNTVQVSCTMLRHDPTCARFLITLLTWKRS